MRKRRSPRQRMPETGDLMDSRYVPAASITAGADGLSVGADLRSHLRTLSRLRTAARYEGAE
jgi:hypothetical protein